MRLIRAIFVLFVIAVIGIFIYGGSLLEHGFNAASQPSSAETYIAGAVRNLAIPDDAKQMKNPLGNTPENLAGGRAHWADHCFTCHANDGSGATEMGHNFYPKVPDMRGPRTQDLTDGELFYIIKNGVPLTGMPAWGPVHEDADNWKLVLFIRHLPQLTPAEEKDMERFNPKSQDDDDAPGK